MTAEGGCSVTSMATRPAVTGKMCQWRSSWADIVCLQRWGADRRGPPLCLLQLCIHICIYRRSTFWIILCISQRGEKLHLFAGYTKVNLQRLCICRQRGSDNHLTWLLPSWNVFITCLSVETFIVCKKILKYELKLWQTFQFVLFILSYAMINSWTVFDTVKTELIQAAADLMMCWKVNVITLRKDLPITE